MINFNAKYFGYTGLTFLRGYTVYNLILHCKIPIPNPSNLHRNPRTATMDSCFHLVGFSK